MAWILGPLLTAFVIAWLGVGAVQTLWRDAHDAVEDVTVRRLFTAVFTAGATKKKKKTIKKYRPQVMNLRKKVDSISGRKH